MALMKLVLATCLLAVVVEGGFNGFPNPRLPQIQFGPPIPPYSYPPGFPYPQLKEIDVLYPPPPRYQEADLFLPQFPPSSIIEDTFDLRPRFPYPTPGGFWPSPRGNARPVIIEEFVNDPLDDARNFNSFQISTTSDGNGGSLVMVTTNDNGKKQTFVSPSSNGRGPFFRLPTQLSSAVTDRFFRRTPNFWRQAANLANNLGDFPDYKIPTFSKYPKILPLNMRTQSPNNRNEANTINNFQTMIGAKPVAVAEILTVKRII